jgi:hypothetical protein
MIARIPAMSASLRTRIFAAVLLVPLVALATATSGVGLRCRITGQVIDACCCDGAGDDAVKADAPATVSEADCCDRVVREVTPTTAEVSAPQRLLPEHAWLLPTLALDVSTISTESSPVRTRSEARASIGPPTVRLRLLSKSTFLI